MMRLKTNKSKIKITKFLIINNTAAFIQYVKYLKFKNNNNRKKVLEIIF